MKKSTNKFELVKNGYDPTAVDKYISNLENGFFSMSEEQKNRIFELKNQLVAAERKIADFNKMSGRIGDAIAEAVTKADQIEKNSMQRLQFEIEQLKAFHERWQEYYAKVMQKYPLDDDLVSVKKFNTQMTKILNTPGKQVYEIRAELDADYSKETKRLKAIKPQIAKEPILSEQKIDELLNKIIKADIIDECTAKEIEAAANTFDPMGRIDSYYSNQETNESFCLKEALTPKDSLKDILKDLGIDGNE